MTPQLLEKIRRVAADERGDPKTRAIAQRQLELWQQKQRFTPKRLHPGMRTSPEYDAWAKSMKASNRGSGKP